MINHVTNRNDLTSLKVLMTRAVRGERGRDGVHGSFPGRKTGFLPRKISRNSQVCVCLLRHVLREPKKVRGPPSRAEELKSERSIIIRIPIEREEQREVES